MKDIQIIDMGDSVFCDACGEDYSNSEAQGGVLFQSKAYCPKCKDGLIKRAEGYRETKYIRGYCPAGMSFKDWVLLLCGGDNKVKIIEVKK